MGLLVNVDIKGNQWNTTYTIINTNIGEVFKRAMCYNLHGIKQIIVEVKSYSKDNNAKIF